VHPAVGKAAAPAGAVGWAHRDGESEACLRGCNQRGRMGSRGGVGQTSGASTRAAGAKPG
jgi:hypothetical protein